MRYATHCIAITFLVTMLLVVGLVRPTFAQEPRDAADWAALRYESVQNLKHIMLAMHNYHDVHKTFPAAYISKDGKPLLSWRVALLPFFEEGGGELYARFRLNEPWDSPHNKQLIEKMPARFRAPPSQLDDGRTVYLTARGKGTAFPGETPVKIREIIDGTSKTIAVIEVEDAQAVPWTRPDDWPLDPAFPQVGFRGQYPEGLNTGFCDGSVHYLRLGIKPDVLGALLTRGGREPVDVPR